MSRAGRLLVIALLLGCTREDPPVATSEEHAQARASSVVLSEAQRRALDVEVGIAGPARIDASFELLGEVRPNGDHLAHIVPRFPGIVRDVRKSIGDPVKSGDVLAIVESSESLAPYELRTLIPGVVLDRHATRGEAIDRERPAFVVADLDTVWVDLAVYQKDLGEVPVGRGVRIHSVEGGPDAEGAISYVTPVVDEATRTATARVVLPNTERRWMPGMFVTARTLDPRDAAVAVPASALQRIDGAPVVFVETPEGFAPRTVVLGRQGESTVEVLSGLAAGERFAATRSFVLRAELEKSEAEEHE